MADDKSPYGAGGTGLTGPVTGKTGPLPSPKPLRRFQVAVGREYSIDLAPVLQDIADAKPADVQAVAASQIELLVSYHQIALAQSRRSFTWALIGSGIGLAFFVAASAYAVITKDTSGALIPAIGGAVVEALAGIVFILYGRTTKQLGDFHGRLETLQRYLLANSICESLKPEAKDAVRSDLIRQIAEITAKPVS